MNFSILRSRMVKVFFRAQKTCSVGVFRDQAASRCQDDGRWRRNKCGFGFSFAPRENLAGSDPTPVPSNHGSGVISQSKSPMFVDSTIIVAAYVLPSICTWDVFWCFRASPIKFCPVAFGEPIPATFQLPRLWRKSRSTSTNPLSWSPTAADVCRRWMVWTAIGSWRNQSESARWPEAFFSKSFFRVSSTSHVLGGIQFQFWKSLNIFIAIFSIIYIICLPKLFQNLWFFSSTSSSWTFCPDPFASILVRGLPDALQRALQGWQRTTRRP